MTVHRWTVCHTGGPEAPKKFVYLKSATNFWPPLNKISFFSPEENFLRWGWIGPLGLARTPPPFESTRQCLVRHTT